MVISFRAKNRSAHVLPKYLYNYFQLISEVQGRMSPTMVIRKNPRPSVLDSGKGVYCQVLSTKFDIFIMMKYDIEVC